MRPPRGCACQLRGRVSSHGACIRCGRRQGQARRVGDLRPIGHLVAEPGHLALGVAAGFGADRGHRLVERSLALGVIDERRARRSPSWPAIPDRAPGRPGASTSASAPSWTICPTRPAMRWCKSGRSGINTSRVAVAGSTIGATGMARCQRTSDRPVASKTSSARTMRPRSDGRRARALSGSTAASRAWRLPVVDLGRGASHGLADLRRDRRHRRQPLGQRLEIEAGAADDDRHAPRLAHLRQHRPRYRRASDRPNSASAAGTWP